MEQAITFPFLTSTNQQEISLLQKSSIFKQINTIQLKHNHIFIKGFTIANSGFDCQEYW